MTITASELKLNISRYLKSAEKEDIVVTKNGKKVARIIHEEDDRVAVAKSLFGILPPEASLDDIKPERMKRYESGN
ncbi:prevent-host-death protein [Spirochaetia bacterium]|nr:prevent-host-death protein [Spirochaetia bacterium]